MKKVSKLFAAKFATGSSVTKNVQGDDEIVIQGDVSDEVNSLPQKSHPLHQANISYWLPTSPLSFSLSLLKLLDLFESTSGKFADIIGNGKIPSDNIVFVDDTKKKKPT
jgi:hypothetical protein